MEIKQINDIAIVNSKERIITDTQTAMDFMMSLKYETGCSKIVLNKEAITEDFFILSKGIAGEFCRNSLITG